MIKANTKTIMSDDMHCVSKNDTALVCYNFDEHRTILITFGRNVAKKIFLDLVTLTFGCVERLA